MHRHTVAVVVCPLLVVAALAGCAGASRADAPAAPAAAGPPAVGTSAAGTSPARLSATPRAGDPADADRALAGPFPLLDFALGPRTVADALPSTTWRLGTGPAMRVSDLVVTGRFVAWEPAGATVWSGAGDATAGAPVPWGDPSAETRGLVMTFQRDAVVAVAPGVATPARLRVSITVDGSGDAAAVGRGLLAGGESVAFLTAPTSPDEATGPGAAWRLAYAGAFLGRVGADGTVTWGVLDAAARLDASRQELADAAHGLHVAELTAAARTARTITVGG